MLEEERNREIDSEKTSVMAKKYGISERRTRLILTKS